MDENNETRHIVEANEFIEALDVFNAYYKSHSNIKVLEITRWGSIIKPLTKTITVEL